MTKSLGFFILFLFFTLNNAVIQVRVINDASFRLQIFPKLLKNPTKCTLTNPRNEVTIISLDNIEANDNTQIEDQKIVPLGGNQCGARIHNVHSSTDVGRWTLEISNPEGVTESEIFQVRTVTWVEPVNTTSTAIVGDARVNIICGPNNILYCDLRDPLGNSVPVTSRTRCESVVENVKVTDFGMWSCTVGVSGSTSEIYATHTLEIGDPLEEFLVFSNKTSSGILITWQVKRIIPSASWCRAFPPNGNSILVEAGLEETNYASAGTDLTRNKCGLLIKGEFLKEYQGIWRLEMGLTSGRTSGGFIKMPEGRIPNEDDPTPTDSKTVNIIVAAGKSFTVTCQTQYPAGYCWIRGPQNQIFTSINELPLGRCSHVIQTSVYKEHNGIWTCNMAHINGGHEQRLITRVNVIAKLYQAVDPEITADRGDETVIACRSVLNHPLKYCRFIRPDGTGLGISPGMKPSDRYSYEGIGLDHGYCGLAISSLKEIDIGEWTCISRSNIRGWEDENSDTIIVKFTETSVASVIGLSIGVVLLLLFAAGIIVERYRRNRARNSDETAIVEYNNNNNNNDAIV